MSEAPRPPDSGARAISLQGRAGAIVSELTSLRDRARSLADGIDALLSEAEDLTGALTWAEQPLEGSETDAESLRHLRPLGAAGRIVVEVAASRKVSLRDVLGPGAARTSAASAARREAISALCERGVGPTDISIVMRLSHEAVRQHRRAA